MTALRSVHIIEGNPSLSAEMLFALVLNAGHAVQWIETSDTRAIVRITRCDGLAEGTATFTINDAQRAGIAGKDNWRKYPRSMLRHRAITEAVSMTCPDISLALPGADSAPVDNEPRTAPTVVQLAPKLSDTPDVSASSPRVSRAETEIYPQVTSPVEIETTTPVARDTTGAPTIEEAVLVDSEPLITPAQMRKIGALIGAWETAREQKLDRDERRHFIGELAGVEDLGSAKDLTRDQASAAIDALATMLAGESQGEEPSP